MKQTFDINSIYRSSRDKMITGLAGGIARHFGFEAIYVRAALVIGLFFAPALVGLSYLIASLLIQER
ncbi:PspC domain-containing protein [Alteromonas oceanisediminis]|uniref:PspC domain-containing protein n=1 Tax=Alteromonas oceanisediminis TaxID=2836180 RepID=UPI001BDB1B44|nr:PspC domain-containing protein [Alteromonas oceanisediminis]MBT0585861.1 PspC domain-containing protein [Alteromonas oceanisediminis]